MKENSKNYLIGFMILMGRLMFIFLDGIFAGSQKLNKNVSLVENSIDQIIQQESEQSINQYQLLTQQNHPSANVSDFDTSKLTDVSKKFNEDINVLEKLYQKNSNLEILKVLIERLIQDYQFDKANEYVKILIKNFDYQSIDPNLYIYLKFNSQDISFASDDSIENILPTIQDYKDKGLISVDNYNFYQGLIKVWYQDYSSAKTYFNALTNPIYKDFVVGFNKTLASFNSSQNIPTYYLDGLISLNMMKNGYFVIAKKIALDALSKDENYILPYQILAYSNFLTNNREVAIEYFSKLSEFDQTNKDLYQFLIGACFYRLDDNQQSMLYLSQVKIDVLQTDVYRYQILNYIKGEDETNLVRTRQKMLGQKDINISDFYNLFYNVFYKPFRNGSPFAIYRENFQLVSMYLNSCDNLFTGGNDVCVLGHVGENLANQNLSSEESHLLSLSNKYSQSYIFHLLGDFYYQQKNFSKSKDYYLKAISICDEKNEEIILQDKINDILGIGN
ncbi:MAG: hypothetical protein WC872_03520 [Candidatus Absconditabacterales bacterium]